MELQVSMECHFLAHSVASIDGMSPPRWFWCKYLLNVASMLFKKFWFCGYRWNVASPRFLKFEVFSNLCFFFLKFGLWISTEMLCLYDFWNLASIDEVSLPCNFEVLEVLNGVRILLIFGLCKYWLSVASRGFLKNHFCLKTRGS